MDKLNILIITYYWPPSGGSGVQRWMYFAKYLKKLGLNPIVLTVDPKYASYNLKDLSLQSQIKDIETYKTFSLEILSLYSFFKSGNKTKSIPQSYIPNKSIFDKITSFIRLNIFIPDSRIGWNYFAFQKAKKIISNNKIDYVITTGPPHSSHLIGEKIYKKYKLKWIVDLRDPWSELFYLKDGFRFNFSKKINEKLETNVIEKADAIITTVGDRYHKILKDKITNPEKIHQIYNGYDKLNYDKIDEINIHQATLLAFLANPKYKQYLISSSAGIVQMAGDTAKAGFMPFLYLMAVEEAERATAFQDPRLKLNIALGYGGRADIIEATKLIASDIRLEKLSEEEISSTNVVMEEAEKWLSPVLSYSMRRIILTGYADLGQTLAFQRAKF